MQALDVELGPATHGWLPVRLDLGGEPIEFSASWIREDSLPQLIGALLSLAEGRPANVEWLLEPEIVEFAFAIHGVQAELVVRQWTPHGAPPKDAAAQLGRWIGPRDELLAAFRRGLVVLEPTLRGDADWRLPFPSALLRRLEAITTL
jgi:hypothetical protein